MEYMRRLPKKKQEQTTTDPSTMRGTPKPLRTLSTKYRDYLSERREASDKMSRTRDSRLRDRSLWREVDQACKLSDSRGQRE